MGSDATSRSAITCAENIAFLYLLHSVPLAPFRNSIDEVSLPCDGYTLSLQDELRLVDTLAFLSSVKGDPKYVPAICVKEDRRTESLNVLIAVNKTTWADGRHVLRTTKQNFEEIFKLLGKVKDGELSTAYFVLMLTMRRRQVPFP
jgi:hypothetical protein